MERNWYLICTKKKQEKKVTGLLTRKGIRNYCPVTTMEKNISASRKITERQPLFSTYIFVHITEEEIAAVKKIPYVVNTVYWKSKPVVIGEEEINSIKMMTDNYVSIKLEKTPVGVTEKVNVMEENTSNHDNSVLTIKHKGLAVTLPALGYRLIGQRENTRNDETKREVASGSSFLSKLNPLFLFGF